jgi:hypothetical protein
MGQRNKESRTVAWTVSSSCLQLLQAFPISRGLKVTGSCLHLRLIKGKELLPNEVRLVEYRRLVDIRALLEHPLVVMAEVGVRVLLALLRVEGLDEELRENGAHVLGVELVARQLLMMASRRRGVLGVVALLVKLHALIHALHPRGLVTRAAVVVLQDARAAILIVGQDLRGSVVIISRTTSVTAIPCIS